MTNYKSNIIIAGYIVDVPLSSLTWHHMQYVLGFYPRDFNLLLVEDTEDYPSWYNPKTHPFSSNPYYELQFINQAFSQYGLQHQWAYYHQAGSKSYRISKKNVNGFIQRTDLFLKLWSINRLPELFLDKRVQVLLDTGPVFAQIRRLTEPTAFNRAHLYDHVFSYGGSANAKEKIIRSWVVN